MAGLDQQRRSDFLAMLLETAKAGSGDGSGLDPAIVCADTRRIIQMTSEALLLRERDRALSHQPFSGCCDTLVGKSKAVSIVVGNLQAAVNDAQAQAACMHLGELAEGVSILTETAAQAVYLVGELHPSCVKARPSIIDHYALSRGRLAIQLAIEVFSRPNTTAAHTMAASAVIATHLEVLRDECMLAGERCTDVGAKQQFKACSKALVAVTAVLVASIKEFVRSPTPARRARCVLFSKPLLECIDAIMSYVHSDETFTGTPATLPKKISDVLKPVQAAALSVVSTTGMLIAACKGVLCDNDPSAPAHVARYGLALDQALEALTRAVKAVKREGLGLEPAEEPAPDYNTDGAATTLGESRGE